MVPPWRMGHGGPEVYDTHLTQGPGRDPASGEKIPFR